MIVVLVPVLYGYAIILPFFVFDFFFSFGEPGYIE